MKVKTLVILSGKLLVLAWFGLREPDKSKGDFLLKNSEPLKELKVNDVTEVKLTKGKEVMLLSKKEKEWRCQYEDLDFPVNFAKIRDFLLSVKDINLMSKVTAGKKYDDKFKLDEKSNPLMVEINAGSSNLVTISLGSMKTGKPTEQGPYSFPMDIGQYLRIKGSDSVVLCKDKIDCEQNPAFWMEKDLVKKDK